MSTSQKITRQSIIDDLTKKGYKGITKLKKEELLKLQRKSVERPTPKPKIQVQKLRLQKITRQSIIDDLTKKGYKGITKLKKEELLKLQRKSKTNPIPQQTRVPNVIFRSYQLRPNQRCERKENPTINYDIQKKKEQLNKNKRKLLKKLHNAHQKKNKDRFSKEIDKINIALERLSTPYKPKPTLQLHRKAFKGFTKTYRIHATQFPNYDLEHILIMCSDIILDKINKDLTIHKGLKIKVLAQVEMVRIDIKTGEEVFVEPYFISKTKYILPTSDISEEYLSMSQEVNEKMVTYQRMGSGWKFHGVICVDLSVNPYRPLLGSSYIPLPKVLKDQESYC